MWFNKKFVTTGKAEKTIFILPKLFNLICVKILKIEFCSVKGKFKCSSFSAETH